MSERGCGDCGLCCTALAVPELDKPNGVECEHLTPEGCGIYDDRPFSCVAFECSWLQGGGRNWDRPDLTGGVMIVERDQGPGDLGDALVIYGDPAGRDVMESPYVMEVVERTVESGHTAFVVVGDKRTLYTQPDSAYALKLAELMEEGDDDDGS
jgi:hypothetical protein